MCVSGCFGFFAAVADVCTWWKQERACSILFGGIFFSEIAVEGLSDSRGQLQIVFFCVFGGFCSRLIFLIEGVSSWMIEKRGSTRATGKVMIRRCFFQRRLSVQSGRRNGAPDNAIHHA